MKLNADGSVTLNGITLTPAQVQEIKLAEPSKRTPTITFAFTTHNDAFADKLSKYPGVVFIDSKIYAVNIGPNHTLLLGGPINENCNYRPWRLEVVE